MSGALLTVVRRDLLLAVRQRGDVINVLLFFLVVATMLPLGVGPELKILRAIGAGWVWVAALLASTVSLSRLFAQDHADGCLEQMLLSGQPAVIVVIGKVIAHWLVTGVPITIAAIPIAIMFDIGFAPACTLMGALALGTPALSLLGAVGAALTLGVRGGGVLVTLLVLPLSAPVLIFGALAVDATAGGLSCAPHLLLLGGLSLGTAALAPWAIAMALRISLE
jgi:heme exporter protein B